MTPFRGLLLLLATLSAASLLADDSAVVHWPSFRGPHASGIATGYPTPTTWNAETSHNVKWKTPIPGLGHSSPVVWGDRVFVTTAISGKADPKLKVGLYGNIVSVLDNTAHSWWVYCLDKRTGKILWKRTVHEGVPRTKRHPKSTHANPTPSTDGKHVVVSFGSDGLYCYNTKGELIWKKDLGVLDASYFRVPSAQWGFASSPIIYKNMVIVQCDVLKGSFIAAFDIKDGKEIWSTARDDVPTWSTPTIHESGLSTQIIVNGYKHIGGYDLKTGKEVWRLKGGGDIPVPTPVVADDLIFITNAHGPMAPIYAIRHNATGDISLQGNSRSNDHIAWSTPRDGAYMQTPLVYRDLLYVCRDNGVLSCYRVKSGQRLYRKRLGSGLTGFSASAVAADGKVYFTSEMGDVHVVKAGPVFELLATNCMDEICMATPAISEGMLLFRTKGHLVAVADLSDRSAAGGQ